MTATNIFSAPVFKSTGDCQRRQQSQTLCPTAVGTSQPVHARRGSRHLSRLHAAEQSAQAISAEDTSTTGKSLDVSNALVDARFRSTPWSAEQDEEDSKRTHAKILFVSESNVCRSVLAQAIMNNLLKANNLAQYVQCESKATRDYNVGQSIEPMVEAAAMELGIPLPQNFTARQCDHAEDVVKFDLILVMDKFSASDFLKEVSVYDTINKEGNYSLKVHRLGEFHPQLGMSKAHDGQDIEDPLYGNVGGQAEKDAVIAAATTISEACNGLLVFLQKVAATNTSNDSFKDMLQVAVKGLNEMQWLAPPMLTPRRQIE